MRAAGDTRATAWAVALAALLHAGLLAFLLLAMLSCASWERAFEWLGVPQWLNPVQCTRPLALPGPVIEATLVGISAAPRPSARPIKTRPLKVTTPPPPAATPPKVPEPTLPRLPVPTLPPPPRHPDARDQERAVALAQQKAEQVQREQQQRERQRMSEVDAARQQADKLLAELDQVKRQSQQADRRTRLEQQKLAQLKDLSRHSTPAPAASVPVAPQATSGNNSQEQSLLAQYQAALVSTITQNWLRPDNVPKGVTCPIRIVQIPGGQVIRVQIEPSCPYDPLVRRSVEAAVMRAQPLPYQGFEKVFQRELTLNFTVNN